MLIKIEPGWKKILGGEFAKPYFSTLRQTIHEAYLTEKIFPEAEAIFNAFNLCPFDQLKVVILGQDPYHGPGQAHGLAFSVPEGIRTPPSLRNIYKEVKSDLGTDIKINGNLERWATQGVLLLNSALTVEQGKPASHQGIGWETFTDAVIKIVSDEKETVVFLLWGKQAQSKEKLIDTSRHLILKAPHPSPLSAHTGFFGCRHFSQTNLYLEENGFEIIKW